MWLSGGQKTVNIKLPFPKGMNTDLGLLGMWLRGIWFQLPGWEVLDIILKKLNHSEEMC